MTEENNIEKPDGQAPVSEETGGQKPVSERNNSGDRLFSRDRVDIYTLLLVVIGLLLGDLYFNISQIDAIRAENAADRAETRADFRALGADIRAGFAGIDQRVVSNDERIDNVYSREIELNQKRNEEEKERDQVIDSLKNLVSSLEEAQESEG